MGLEPYAIYSCNVLMIYKESVFMRLGSLPIRLSGPFTWIYFPSPYRAGWMRRLHGLHVTAPLQAWPSWDMMSGPNGEALGREAP